ncbi:hypothetical protein I3F58_09590 [Streptomyces sp. MUM 203J]|uniref:hypothetical protein n=1 Tax=Streptomyces sp. MUM 203J TaxID=2791990 RepID=UPI001F043DBF|nr:hypothetical protein [Streptomyces sp. MUM 203J]MCH0539812.1 hypothetical protein [Streptomyces sp. MUM 203J]
MQIHRTRCTRDFTTFPNELLRDPNLSFTALGVIVYLLSLPEEARRDIRKLANRRDEGRIRVGKALRQLEGEGYLRRDPYQDSRTGYWKTDYEVYDTPSEPAASVRREAAAPAPVRAVPSPLRNLAAGDPEAGPSGALPPEERTELQEPPSPPDPAPPAPRPATLPSGRAAALLAGLGRRERRLALGAAETTRLGSLVEEWFAVGATESDIRDALTSGLPQQIHSPAALLADRLTRKKPAPPPPAPEARPPHPECEHCRAPVPPGASCRACTPPPPTLTARVASYMTAAQRGAFAAREAMRRAPETQPGPC